MKNVLLVIVGIALMFSCSKPSDLAKIEELRDSIKVLSENGKEKLLADGIDFGGEFIKSYASKADLNQYINSVTVSQRIDSISAYNKLIRYKFWRDMLDDNIPNSSINWKDEIYGHLFTWNELNDFIKHVEQLNTLRPANNKIDGLRVYHAAEFRNGFIPDVFLMPTVKSKNLYDIDPDFPSILKSLSEEEILEIIKTPVNINSDDAILNKSLPCPDECPTK